MRIVTLTIVMLLGVASFTAAQDASAHRSCVREALPTLGGPNTFVFGINSHGQVVGSSSTADATGHSSGQHAFSWEQGQPMQGLQNLPGSQISLALGLNDSGLIVGNAIPDASPEIIPVAWIRGSLVKLSVLTSTPISIPIGAATAVNNRGQIVGTFGSSHCLVWKDVRSQPVELANLGGEFCRPHAINDQGVIVGEATTSDGVYHAVMWRDGKLIDLSRSLPFSAALGVNNAGQTIGIVVEDAVTNVLHPAEWTRSRSLTVFELPGYAQSINESGDFAVFDNPGTEDSHLKLVDRRGSVHDLGPAGGIPSAFFINDRRQAAWTVSNSENVYQSFFCPSLGT